MNIPKLLPLLVIFAAAVPAADAQITVSSATPSMAEQDTISLDVTIVGSGFSRGSTAQWFVSGTTNPGGVIVNSTRYVNGGKLVANITVSAGANLSSYDIMVRDRDGRSGKGIELFKVVEKVVGCVLPQNTGFQQIATLNTGAFGPEFGAAVAAKEIRGSGTPVLVAATFGGRAQVYTLDNINTSADPWQVSLSHRMTVDFGGSIRWMDMGYVNGDVYPDIGIASQGSQKAWVALSRPTAADGFTYDVVELVPPAGFANYGRSIAIGDIDGVPGDEVVVSSIGGKSGGRTLPGKVATFFFNGTGLDWKQTIADPVTAGGTGFGTSVALGRLTSDAYADLVVGSPSNSVVYVYNKTQSSANEQAYGASSSYATDRQENLGYRVRVAGGFSGPPGRLLASTDWNVGEPRALLYAGEPFLQLAPTSLQSRGWSTGVATGSLDSDGIDDILVGSPNAPDNTSCTNSIGAVHAYLSGSMWAGVPLFPPSQEGDFQGFGWSVAVIPGTRLVMVGEHGRNIGSTVSAGQVYIFRLR